MEKNLLQVVRQVYSDIETIFRQTNFFVVDSSALTLKKISDRQILHTDNLR